MSRASKTADYTCAGADPVITTCGFIDVRVSRYGLAWAIVGHWNVSARTGRLRGTGEHEDGGRRRRL